MWVKVGDRLCSAEPLAAVVDTAHRMKVCHNCFSWIQMSLRCSKCKFAYYCTKRCQVEAWSTHKRECSHLVRLRQPPERMPTETFRLMARLLWFLEGKQDRPHEEHLPSLKPIKRTFADLMSHKQHMLDDVDTLAFAKEILVRYLDGKGSDMNRERFADFFGKIRVNAFSICDAELNPVGLGLYLGPSVLNHSCNPTAVVTFNKRTLNVTAVRDMEIVDMSEATISYISIMARTKDRQKELLSSKYFLCRCDRCTNDSLDGCMVSLKCREESCEGVMLPQKVAGGLKHLTCMGCNLLDLTQDADQVYDRCMEEINAIKDKKKRIVDKTERGTIPDLSGALDECRQLVSEWGRRLGPYNVALISLYDLAVDLAIEMGKCDRETRRWAEATLKPYKMYYGRLHPAYGVQLCRLGALCGSDNDVSGAIGYYRAALLCFDVTHGAAHPFVRNVKHRSNLLEIERKLMNVSLDDDGDQPSTSATGDTAQDSGHSASGAGGRDRAKAEEGSGRSTREGSNTREGRKTEEDSKTNEGRETTDDSDAEEERIVRIVRRKGDSEGKEGSKTKEDSETKEERIVRPKEDSEAKEGSKTKMDSDIKEDSGTTEGIKTKGERAGDAMKDGPKKKHMSPIFIV